MKQQAGDSERFSWRRSRPAMRLLAVALAMGLLGALLLVWSGCGGGEADDEPVVTHSRTTSTVPTTPAPAAATIAPGILLDPNLQSSTGTPSADEIKQLIGLQAQVPYPIMVPTNLPSGCQLDTSLLGASQVAGDPTGYYSFRYYDPNNQSRTLTFNQSSANAEPLSGYYLTEETIGGTDFQVYWHRTREYLPNGAPVRTTQVVNAETYVVTWKGQYTDAAGASHELNYGLTVGTWSGWSYSDIRSILTSIKPLSQVNQ